MTGPSDGSTDWESGEKKVSFTSPRRIVDARGAVVVKENEKENELVELDINKEAADDLSFLKKFRSGCFIFTRSISSRRPID
jgi:hypothetical protein